LAHRGADVRPMRADVSARLAFARLLPPSPWSSAFLRQWLPHLTVRSSLRLRNHEVRNPGRQGSEGKLLPLDVVSPLKGRVFLREAGSDVSTFEEIVKTQIYKVVVHLAQRCEAIIDLGAHIGLASLYFASQYQSARLFAVEPNPSSYNLLTMNLARLIAFGQCHTLQAAVWGASAPLVAAATDEPEHYSMFSLRPADGAAEASIPGVTIHQILDRSGFDRVDLLKVDIEGAEVQLFQGDLSWLRRVRVIAIEFHGGSRKTSGFDEIVSRYGFRVCDRSAHTVVAVRPADGLRRALRGAIGGAIL
jgi:FkbM family methyltransferase